MSRLHVARVSKSRDSGSAPIFSSIQPEILRSIVLNRKQIYDHIM